MRQVIALVVALVLSACNREPTHPHAGQKVVPIWGGPGGGSSSSEKRHLSLYEYSDGQRYIITGKSVSFEMPEYFTQSTDNHRDGPQIAIWTQFAPPSDTPASSSDQNAISATLFDHAVGYAAWPMEDEIIEKGRFPQMPGLMRRQPLMRKASDYCGYQAYQRTDQIRSSDRDAADQASRSPNWPFADAVVLARPLSSGRFYPVITCSTHVNSDHFPYCGMNTVYRGWPLSIRFSGARACHAAEVADHVRSFFDRYRVNETERSPGEKEHRY